MHLKFEIFNLIIWDFGFLGFPFIFNSALPVNIINILLISFYFQIILSVILETGVLDE